MLTLEGSNFVFVIGIGVSNHAICSVGGVESVEDGWGGCGGRGGGGSGLL